MTGIKRELFIDVESFSLRADAVVTSVGYAELQTASGLVKSTNSGSFNLTTAKALNTRHICASTMLWLMQNPAAMPSSFVDGQYLEYVQQELQRLGEQADRVWTSYMPLDVGSLNLVFQDAFDLKSEDTLWPYWKNRCFRTWADFHPEVERVAPTVAHNAEADARAMMMTFIKGTEPCSSSLSC